MESPIQQLVPPVVIISACGVLCMAQFGRYTALIGRVREMHKERLLGLERLRTLRGQAYQFQLDRCNELESESHEVLGLIGLVRYGLLCLVGAVILMIVSSLFIGVEFFWVNVGRTGAVVAFVGGLLAMLLGMIFVFREVRLSLRVVLAEHDRLEALESVPVEPISEDPTGGKPWS